LTILLRLPEQVLDAIQHVIDDNIVFQQDNAPAPVHLHSTQFSCCNAKCQLPFSGAMACNSSELNSTDYKI